jgi:hypothetical protein
MIAKKSAIVICTAALASVCALGQEAIPNGTILPARLDTAISSTSAPGSPIVAVIMQDLKLANGTAVRHGAKVTGEVVSSTPASSSEGARISLRFDKIIVSGQKIPITSDLRAMASLMEVDEAQIPESGPDYGTPKSAWTTQQIGGDTVYRGGGPVMEGSTAVGEPVYDGVTGHAVSSADGECRGAIDGNDELQALWVFSANACGLYGMANVKIVHAGRSEPAGEIMLESRRGKLRIPRGTGMLLRVIGGGSAKTL